MILVQLVVVWSVGLFPRLTAIDFYQYWGVGAALRLSGSTLGSPYQNYEKYHAVLRDHAAQSGQPKLATVARAMPRPGFTGTPFLYMLLGALPADYTRAIALFQALQVLLFLAAVFLLGMLYRYQPFPLVCLALLLVVSSGPLFADLRVGNLGSLQFAALAVLLALADRLQRARALILGGVVLTGFTALVLAKPNVALVVPMIVVHLWVVHGSRFLAIAAIPAVLFAGAAVVVPCLYFDSWTVWQEWYGFVYGRNPSAMARPSAGGNYSTPVLVARWVQTDVWTVALVIAAVLGVSLIAVVVAAVRGHAGPAAKLRRGLERVFGDVHPAMAIGITATIALSPLFWYHYNVIALIPGLWLLHGASGSPYLPLCGLAALTLGVGLLNALFLPLGWPGAAEIGAAVSWIPLWAGILLHLSAARVVPPRGTVADEPPAPTSGERQARKARIAPRSRRSKAPRG